MQLPEFAVCCINDFEFLNFWSCCVPILRFGSGVLFVCMRSIQRGTCICMLCVFVSLGNICYQSVE